MKIELLHAVGGVARYHGKRSIRSQTNADHSWGVAVLLQHFYPTCSKELILACLYHDMPEYLTGDIPGPTKRDCKDLRKVVHKLESKFMKDLGIKYKITAKEKKILKICDLLELVLYLEMLYNEGNTIAFPMMTRAIVQISGMHKHFSPSFRRFFNSKLKQYLEE